MLADIWDKKYKATNQPDPQLAYCTCNYSGADSGLPCPLDTVCMHMLWHVCCYPNSDSSYVAAGVRPKRCVFMLAATGHTRMQALMQHLFGNGWFHVQLVPRTVVGIRATEVSYFGQNGTKHLHSGAGLQHV